MSEFNYDPDEEFIKTQIVVGSTMHKILKKMAKTKDKSPFVRHCIESSPIYKKLLKEEKDG